MERYYKAKEEAARLWSETRGIIQNAVAVFSEMSKPKVNKYGPRSHANGVPTKRGKGK